MGFWAQQANRFQNQGPVWEIPNGKQMRLDYKAVSILNDLLGSQEGGEIHLQQIYYRKADRSATMCDTIFVRADGERLFFEYLRCYPRSDSDLMEMPGGFPAPNDPGMTHYERFRMVWEPDYSTSVTWEWTPDELKEHLTGWEGES